VRAIRLATSVLIGVLLIGASVAPAAVATIATTASLSMVSEEGDWVGSGLSYSYSTETGNTFDSNSAGGTNNAGIVVNDGTEDWWVLVFSAPDDQTLVPGTYSGATRFGFNGPGEPGLEITGNSRGCNILSGSFTVLDVSYGPYNYLERFHATFEQYCDFSPAALRGEINIINPPVPDPLQLRVEIAPIGTANPKAGTATANVTAWCNRPVTGVELSVDLIQHATSSKVAKGYFFVSFDCTGTETWNATVSSESLGPFTAGKAQVSAELVGFDDATTQYVIANGEAEVRLRPA
jgi:hypothetical protein